jgi:hypothetical protein
MRGTMRQWLWFITIFTSFAGCSLFLDWDPNGLLCDAGVCSTGYTCLGDRCIRDQSIAQGGTCSISQQCETGLVCQPGIGNFICVPGCNLIYQTPPECSATQFCAPPPTGETYGNCTNSECTIDSDCEDASESCVQISAQANACLKRCTISFAGATYSDTCTSGGTVSACQPVGEVGAESLVCLDIAAEITPKIKGANCAIVTAPCEKTLDCRVFSDPTQNVCVRFCANDNHCNIGQLEHCCSVVSDSATYGFCATSCS